MQFREWFYKLIGVSQYVSIINIYCTFHQKFLHSTHAFKHLCHQPLPYIYMSNKWKSYSIRYNIASAPISMQSKKTFPSYLFQLQQTINVIQKKILIFFCIKLSLYVLLLWHYWCNMRVFCLIVEENCTSF